MQQQKHERSCNNRNMNITALCPRLIQCFFHFSLPHARLWCPSIQSNLINIGLGDTGKSGVSVQWLLHRSQFKKQRQCDLARFFLYSLPHAKLLCTSSLYSNFVYIGLGDIGILCVLVLFPFSSWTTVHSRTNKDTGSYMLYHCTY